MFPLFDLTMGNSSQQNVEVIPIVPPPPSLFLSTVRAALVIRGLGIRGFNYSWVTDNGGEPRIARENIINFCLK